MQRGVDRRVVLFADHEAGPRHLLLGVVHERLEERPVGIELTQPLRVLGILFQQRLERRPGPVPPRHVVAHLRPGEDPRDRAEVLEDDRARCPRWRPRRDRQPADVLERRGGRVPLPEPRIVDQLPVRLHRQLADPIQQRRPRGIGFARRRAGHCRRCRLRNAGRRDTDYHRVHDLLEVPPRDCRQRVPERDHLALLGPADPPVAAARRRRQDRPIGPPATAADRPAAPVKEPEVDARRLARLSQFSLHPVQRPVRPPVAAVLVAVRVPEHHLLEIPPRRQVRPVGGVREQRPHQRPCLLQVRHRLEQRHDVEIARHHTVGPPPKPHLLHQQQHRQQVADVMRHADDVAADGGRVLLALLPQQLENLEHRAGVVAQLPARGRQRPRVAQLAPQHRDLLVLVERQVVFTDLAEPQELCHHARVHLRVLPHIQRREMQPERLRLRDHVRQYTVLGHLGQPRRRQALLQPPQLRPEIVRTELGFTPQCPQQPLVQRVHLQPEGLILQVVERRGAQQAGRVVFGHRRPELRAGRVTLRRHAQVQLQLFERLPVQLDHRAPQYVERRARHVGRHARVPVPVPPDPRAVTQDRRQRRPRVVVRLQRVCQVTVELRHRRPDRRLHEVQPVADLLADPRALAADLVGPE